MINQYFTRKELICKGVARGICSCGFNSIDTDTLELITAARIYFANPYHIKSACRCFKYNEIVQKENNPYYAPHTSNSMHMYARAIDGYIETVPVEMLYSYFADKLAGKGGLGIYPTFVHVDTASGPGRRW